jgi:ribosomal protein L40E
MPSNRPNLILDEQAFQDLLSAAFTIQEHNARLNQVRPTEIKSQVLSKAEPDSFCQRCGAPKPAQESRCRHCGLDEFRPGERMQRKWASMWLMSQEQTLWPEQPGEVREALHEIREALPELPADTAKMAPTFEASQEMRGGSARDSGFKDFLSAPLAPEVASETPTAAAGEAETIHQLFRRPSPDDWQAREDPATESPWIAESKSLPDLPKEVLAPQSSDVAARAFSLPTTDTSYPADRTAPEGITTVREIFGATTARTVDRTTVDRTMDDRTMADRTSDSETAADPAMVDAAWMDAGSDTYASSLSASPSTSPSPSLRRRLGDLRVTLRFHRANLYLGAAIILAACALMWPTVSAPQRDTLSPMEKILVALGVAEAPAPVIHSVGDPGIDVWVDPHTALYYCPGEDQYGKTADGRVSSQHDAQMDRFQPAGRAVCE